MRHYSSPMMGSGQGEKAGTRGEPGFRYQAGGCIRQGQAWAWASGRDDRGEGVGLPSRWQKGQRGRGEVCLVAFADFAAGC
jgi:hypothetical protein